MVGETERRVDTYEQLRRRLKKIVYHFKNDNGEYMTYTMKGNEYVDREDIIARIKGNIDPDRFRKIETQPELTHPFEIQ